MYLSVGTRPDFAFIARLTYPGATSKQHWQVSAEVSCWHTRRGNHNRENSVRLVPDVEYLLTGLF